MECKIYDPVTTGVLENLAKYMYVEKGWYLEFYFTPINV
jgi:hypothetical protein